VMSSNSITFKATVSKGMIPAQERATTTVSHYKTINTASKATMILTLKL
jgi:hypothetical protein